MGVGASVIVAWGTLEAGGGPMVTARYSTFSAMDTIEDRIGSLLRAQPGTRYCDGCLALEVKATLAEAKAAVSALDRDAQFKVAEGECSSCLRHKLVACAVRR
jgi:hypothetical protein